MFRIITLWLAVSGFSAMASDCGASLEEVRSWAQPSTFELLLREVRAKTVFTQVTNERKCPKTITLDESESRPLHALPEDRFIRLRPEGGNFTHEQNYLSYRPSIVAQKPKRFERCIGFRWGFQSSSSTQCDVGGILSSGFSATVFSIGMIARVKSKVSYDSNSRTIRYHYESPGVDSVDCVFEKNTATLL
jgi:hypothetical protein